ncbi:AGE family epimerase/isomerase [Lipingzhangella sp. LS1_29]|uniref:AGE family epimerase/isomerase n=1 Tax=Lipingzhangella rawalii TaxID=2055835 RepID=A0ABU2H495_9ACTN|nr:AGE family epimerase/isomerase [Lipingzhangella rawalii]MDS1270134.1 AGE family epimerase/isomerase [Lipingzhangella rawalii]
MTSSHPSPAPTSPSPHLSWLHEQRHALVRWAWRARHPHGFAWLGDDGSLDHTHGIQLWITARMTHVAALAHRHGDEAARELAGHGVAALRGALHDEVSGGWFSRVDGEGAPSGTNKAGYEHAFVLLAAASATSAAVPGAPELLREAREVVLERFWDEKSGLCRESWDRRWRVPESYGGANSNMHMVEAFLAASAATGDADWVGRAQRIADFLIGRQARAYGYRLPEHYTPEWTVLPEYNRERPDDPFRPYGWTPGHSIEWARLLVHLEAAQPEAPTALVEHAEALFDTAVRNSWSRDGADGFCYTLDWTDEPVVRLRMHWVVAEAAAAAEVLHRRTGSDHYRACAERWWAYIRTHLTDGRDNWRHELGENNQPSAVVWQGRPDVYHGYTATALAAGLSIPGYAIRSARN